MGRFGNIAGCGVNRSARPEARDLGGNSRKQE
jgi:hypothetical protein